MYVSPSCAYEVSCRVRAPPNGKTRQRATNPYRVKGGYSPSGPGPEFTPRKARGLTGDGFPAAVPAFLLIGAPGPEWTAFGAVGPEVQVRPRGTATSATIQTSATNCQPLRNRHNGCITTGKVARTDPFPQIAAGAGQPRAPAGRSTEIRRPFHPFGAAITRCFHRQPRAAHTDPPPAGVVDHARWRGIRLGGQCRQRWAGERDKPWQGTVHRGRPSAARGWAPSRHRAAPHPCGHVAVLPVVVRGGDLRCSTSLG